MERHTNDVQEPDKIMLNCRKDRLLTKFFGASAVCC